MTQKQRILAYMRDHGSITPMDAFQELGITKLATRISEMRDTGQRISRSMETARNRYGEVVRYMRYRLAE